MRLSLVRRQLYDFAKVRNCLLFAVQFQQDAADVVVRLCGLRIEVRGPGERGERLLAALLLHERDAERVERVDEVRVSDRLAPQDGFRLGEFAEREQAAAEAVSDPSRRNG